MKYYEFEKLYRDCGMVLDKTIIKYFDLNQYYDSFESNSKYIGYNKFFKLTINGITVTYIHKPNDNDLFMIEWYNCFELMDLKLKMEQFI